MTHRQRGLVCAALIVALFATGLVAAATNDYYTNENTGNGMVLYVLANDTEATINSKIASCTQPTSGSVSWVSSSGYVYNYINYYPQAGYYGTVTFYYTAYVEGWIPALGSFTYKVTITLLPPQGTDGRPPRPVL